MAGKIIHGNKNFYYFPISDGAFGTPVQMTGLVSFEMEIDQETTNIYADDEIYAAVKGAKVRTATGTFRKITDAYAEYLGFYINANGGVSDSGSFPNHGICFTTTEYDGETGDETTRLHYLYNVTGSEPTFSSTTDEDEIEAQEIEVEYSALASSIAVDDEGNSVQYYYIDKTDTNATVFNTFTTTVLLPTTSMS